MSTSDSTEDKTVYKVVVNHEEQYSIWPADRDVPAGWTETGPRGTKDVCLAHVESVWTDMRPRSLREAMAKAEPEPEAGSGGEAKG